MIPHLSVDSRSPWRDVDARKTSSRKSLAFQALALPALRFAESLPNLTSLAVAVSSGSREAIGGSPRRSLAYAISASSRSR